MRKISIVTTKCKRCGKSLSTTSRSLLGLDAEKIAFGDVCKDCVTPEEMQSILNVQGKELSKLEQK